MSRKKPEIETNSGAEVRLGTFTFSLDTNEVRDINGKPVHLRSQTTKVLSFLARHLGQLVPKTTLIENCWDATFVTDDNLVQCITEIRRTLGDREHRIVQTLPKKGYRIIGSPFATESVAPDVAVPDRPSIGVLAFEDHSTGTEKGFLSDAISEGVIAELSRFPELFVVARNSSFSFRGRPTDVKDIARSLGVRYLVEGSQQKSGNQLRVTVQLIDAKIGDHLWSEVYNRELSDLFSVQDDIVARVVSTAAQRVIRLEGRNAAKSDTSKLTALLHHLQGRAHLERFTPAANELSRQANLAAIDADPSQPYGYVGLAFACINGHRWGWSDRSPQEALASAREAARKALELAPDYYDGHAAMAYVHLQENDLDRAIARGRRVLELNPNDTHGMCDLAEFYGYAGRTEEAELLLHKAMRRDPLHSDWIKWDLAWVQWLAGNCSEALKTLDGMSHVPPMAYRVLAVVHVCLGNFEKAKNAIAQLLSLDPEATLTKVAQNDQGKFKNAADFKRLIGNLRAAGLPE